MSKGGTSKGEKEGNNEGKTHGSNLLQLLHHLLDLLPHQRRMNRHTDVHLTRTDQIHNHPESIQRSKDLGEESMTERLSIRVDVDDYDLVLDGNGGREMLREPLDGSLVDRELSRLRVENGSVGLRVDDGSSSERVLDVLDSDGDGGSDDLFHGEGVDDLRTVVGKLGGFVGSDDGDETSGGDFARVGGEDTVDLLPDLKFGGIETDGAECSTEIGVASSNLLEEGSRDDSEVS